MEQPKVGVYVCDCGVNIAATSTMPEGGSSAECRDCPQGHARAHSCRT
jgi:hypothetical protein